MGLFTGLLTLPLAPVRGVAAVAEVVREQAEREYYDPAVIRRKLEEIERQRAEGTLSEQDAEAMEDELTARLLQQPLGPVDEER